MVRWIDDNGPAQLADLERLVNVNSGTLNVAGVREVGAFFAEALQELGFDVHWVDLPAGMNRAGHLFARRRGTDGQRLLLIGHLDTVFPPESPFQRFALAGQRATGPGVDDMKDGDLVILYALRAVHREGLLDGRNITVALMGDEEEPGAPPAVSRAALIEAARASDVALGFESGYDRSATIGRRGASGWRLEVTARRGHSSRVLSDELGAGAAYELARIVDAMRQSLQGDPTLTINPSLLLAGSDLAFDEGESRGTAAGKVNVVADSAAAMGDLRFLSDAQGQAARETMQAIVARSLPEAAASITFREFYPAMPPTEGNRRLLTLYSGISEAVGAGPVQPKDPLTMGAADISWVAAYVDALDGLGSWGGRNHSTEEYLDVPSLAVATKRAAIMIHRLTR